MPNPANRDVRHSPEVTERVFRQLCHLLSLDRSGKVQGAVESLTTTVLHIDPNVGTGADPGELALAIATYFGVKIDETVIKTAINSQIQAGRLIVDKAVTPHRIVLAPSVHADVATRIDEATRLETMVKDDWINQIESFAEEIDPSSLWRALQHYLGLVFREHGVEAVQLLDPSAKNSDNGVALGSALEKAIKDARLIDHQLIARRAITAFFRDSGPSRLRYMSELLDGTFTFFALTVGDSTAEYLKSQLPPLKLFLDTNVILGVVGLQDNDDNPLQGTCDELLAFIERGKYPFRLYCHERTLREFNTIKTGVADRLSARRYPSQISKAYIQVAKARHSSGVEMSFHRRNAETEIDVAAFLARFDHIEELLKARNVDIYRQNGPDLDVEKKGAYVAEFEHFLGERPRAKKRRYDALDHDISLWMYLQRIRSHSTSALRTGALLLSNDIMLHTFDKSFLMDRPGAKEVITVVLPHHLMQVLRPLSSNKNDYDEQFISIFAVPEFRTAQTDYDSTISDVMRCLASYDDMPKELAIRILNDDLLMQQLSNIDAEDTEFTNLIDKAIFTDNAMLAEQVALLESDRDKAEQISHEHAESTKTEIEALKRQAKETERREEEARAQVRDEVARREKAEQELEAEHAARLSIIRRLRWALVALLGASGVVLILRGPEWFTWTSFLKHPNHVGIQALASVAWAGLAFTIAPVAAKYRGAVLASVVACAIITALALL
jgi:hypothetical protein